MIAPSGRPDRIINETRPLTSAASFSQLPDGYGFFAGGVFLPSAFSAAFVFFADLI
jgi:hypothetical protein